MMGYNDNKDREHAYISDMRLPIVSMLENNSDSVMCFGKVAHDTGIEAR